MRSAAATENFPYRMSTVCYIEVEPNGQVSQVPHKNKSDLPGVKRAWERAVNGESALYAVWPGQWSSDLFAIDDLERFAEEFGFRHP
ncbi:MAG: hypothetical protein KH009_00355 [Clostridiales bacterium]|nr:hypothetical protein [Clostridiales bacterium]